jgi:hypothetical protein
MAERRQTIIDSMFVECERQYAAIQWTYPITEVVMEFTQFGVDDINLYALNGIIPEYHDWRSAVAGYDICAHFIEKRCRNVGIHGKRASRNSIHLVITYNFTEEINTILGLCSVYIPRLGRQSALYKLPRVLMRKVVEALL